MDAAAHSRRRGWVADRKTLWRWRQHPDFAARVAERREAQRLAIEAKGLADRDNRLRGYQDRYDRLQLVIDERAADEHMAHHPGGARTWRWPGWPRALIARHATGDWGELDPEDARENAFSLRRGFRILSSYLVAGEKVWIITEADRSGTTILMAAEY